MWKTLWDRLEQAERSWRRSFGTDITDPAERRRARWHYNWLDHAVLRTFWFNFREIAPGIYRSNQPTHRRLAALKARGVRTILNLRGQDKFAHYLFLKESCDALGLRLVDVKLNATQAPARRRLIELLDAFETIERPFVMHCKSGADRTGLAAALYMMVHEGQSLAQARAQLSWRHIHFRSGEAGIMDEVLDAYEARLGRGPIPVADWIRTEYDPRRVARRFRARRRRRR